MKVFITGVSKGIGKALVAQFESQGHEVWGVARTNTEGNASGNSVYTSCDITQESDVDNVIKQMQEQSFYPDIVILNAGIEKPDTEKGYDHAVGKEIFATNYNGALVWVDRFLRFPKQPSQFLAVSTVFALRPNDQSSSYSASKAALSMMFRGLRYQFDRKKITFKLIYLVAVNTVIKPSYQVYMSEKKPPFFVISPEKAAQFIINALKSSKENFYSHFFLSSLIRITQILPDRLFKKLTDPFRR